MSDDRLKALEERVAKLEGVIAAIGAVFGAGGGSSDAAKDRELDGQYGDEEVRFIPRDWTAGGVNKGQRFSTCPAEFLELLAETYDFFEGKNRASGAKTTSGKPKADFDKRSARLCRGWARRLRSGWKPPEKPSVVSTTGASRFGGGGGAFGGGPRLVGQSPANPYGGPFGASRAMPPDDNDAAEPEDDANDANDDFPHGANEKPVTETRMVDDELDDEPPLQLAGGAT